jgi:uncharacterized coiled-coil DUF342 family protein
MSDSTFTETFDLERFTPDISYDELISRFENGRTAKEIPMIKNKTISIEEFTQQTKPTKPQTKEELITYLEALEKQIDEQNKK